MNISVMSEKEVAIAWIEARIAFASKADYEDQLDLLAIGIKTDLDWLLNDRSLISFSEHARHLQDAATAIMARRCVLAGTEYYKRRAAR